MELIIFMCLIPLLIFAAGWFSCYVLMVRYRLRLDRRNDYESANSRHREEAWQP